MKPLGRQARPFRSSPPTYQPRTARQRGNSQRRSLIAGAFIGAALAVPLLEFDTEFRPLGWVVCALLIALGLWAHLGAGNRARGGDSGSAE